MRHTVLIAPNTFNFTKKKIKYQLTFSVHGYSNRWLEPFVVHQAFDGHVLQQPWFDGQRTDDQRGPIALWELRRHRGAHGAVIPLHVPHYLSRGAWQRGAVGFDHTWRDGLVAHLRFGQHWEKYAEKSITTHKQGLTVVDVYGTYKMHCAIMYSSVVLLCCVKHTGQKALEMLSHNTKQDWHMKHVILIQ